jgi:hypothetical protein
MTNQNEKSQLMKKLLRWAFVFIIVLSLLQIPLFIIMGETGSKHDLTVYLVVASLVGIILCTILIFAVGPIVIKLFDIRKKEKQEKEDPGMFV